MSIAKGGLNWILVPLTFGIISIVPYFIIKQFYFLILGILWFIVTVFFLIFFRDPSRVPPKDQNLIVAPADGKILNIDNINRNQIRICTFMNIYDVHVNRMPIDGQIIQLTHKLGGFKPAYNKESDQNERVEISVKTKLGKVDIIQIAGILARRIEPYVEEKEKVKRGQRFGLIRLGSRVDLILPKNKVHVVVKENMKVQAGTSVVAKIR
jgi:phosphatidylserine decarboxylase